MGFLAGVSAGTVGRRRLGFAVVMRFSPWIKTGIRYGVIGIGPVVIAIIGTRLLVMIGFAG
ncbi:hypothetical protein SAMN04489716_6636 [Actinoplanes derwentensis]|uniref:Uncharacterized protein n=1 Tax=Actinoplanes derwentensis TaxID=113562 RepID=A0A1H2CS31_9ACTN|nr:hypothetical protein Ade03nite_44210 [Actinoplanes derwentensis]SDT73335.1 hypothetical protein SAMN04489716_6636 [Actinoplanes derwentensis]